jgi:hypothetical protein
LGIIALKFCGKIEKNEHKKETKNKKSRTRQDGVLSGYEQ